MLELAFSLGERAVVCEGGNPLPPQISCGGFKKSINEKMK
jgi:hypothetical protein